MNDESEHQEWIVALQFCTASFIWRRKKRMKLIAAIATPIAKSQHMREMWFHVMSGGAMLKIVVMEIARITQMF